MAPNPTALRSLIKPEQVEEHRCLSCVEYDGCLSTVLRHTWRSWTCTRCSMFQFAREMRAAAVAHEGALRPYA